MYKFNCACCSLQFEANVKNRKYCSKKCFFKSKPSPNSDNIRKGLEKYYKSSEYLNTRDERNRKISQKNKVIISNEDIKKLEEILHLGFTKDLDIVIRKGMFSFKKKVLARFIKDNIEWYNKFNIKDFIPSSIQKLSNDEFLEFREFAEKNDHRQVEKKYNLSNKSFRSICNKLDIKWNKIEHWYSKITKPESKVISILESNKINFQREKYVNNSKYRIDFLLDNNKVIEVQGDFWHANPKLFDYNNLTNTQSKNVIRDIAKKDWLIKNNYKLLEIWEYDLKNNIQEIEKQILQYANSN